MKVVVIGATGTIGGAVADALDVRHEVIRASRSGPLAIDLEELDSIEALFASVGNVDAVVCCAASAPMRPLLPASDNAFIEGLEGKLLGQVHLTRQAFEHVRDGGSVTLTSGVFKQPTPGAALGALVNAGLEAFVRTAALEAPRGLRLNIVSPGWVRETLARMGLDVTDGAPAKDVARAYVNLVEGTMQGRIVSISNG